MNTIKVLCFSKDNKVKELTEWVCVAVKSKTLSGSHSESWETLIDIFTIFWHLVDQTVNQLIRSLIVSYSPAAERELWFNKDSLVSSLRPLQWWILKGFIFEVLINDHSEHAGRSPPLLSLNPTIHFHIPFIINSYYERKFWCLLYKVWHVEALTDRADMRDSYLSLAFIHT